MTVQNQNLEIDSLKITQNKDGFYTMDWSKDDPKWNFLNSMTSNEIQIIIEQAIKEHLDGL